MKLIPDDRFTIFTPDSSSMVLKRLIDKIEPPQTFRVGKNIAPYQGMLFETGFKISRIIHYRNSFLPVIQGQFEALETGTNIHIEMSLHPAVLIFLGIWCSFWYTGLIPMVIVGAVPLAIGLLCLIIPLGMMTIFSAAFWKEARRSRQELTRMIQGEKGSY